jgi:hypothetical protein
MYVICVWLFACASTFGLGAADVRHRFQASLANRARRYCDPVVICAMWSFLGLGGTDRIEGYYSFLRL